MKWWKWTASVSYTHLPEIKGVNDDAFFETEEYAIGVKKGNQELLDKVNAALKEIKEAGRIEEIAKEVDARLK